MKARNLVTALALAASLAAGAQEEEGEFGPALPPPDIPDPLQSGEAIEPQVTIVRRGDAVIEEYRAGGVLFMIKITPKVGKPYYLVDQDGDGRMETRMGKIHDNFVVPQWVIFSW